MKTWPHPPRGTCVPECSLYGRCHCGCGQFTRQAQRTRPDSSAVTGEPHVYRPSHHTKPNSGAWGVRGIDVGKVRPVLRWMADHHGVAGTARLLSVPFGWVNTQLYCKRTKKTNPERARRVYVLFNAMRPEYDLPPLIATEYDADRARRARNGEVQIERSYKLTEGIRNQEERLAAAKRDERRRLSLMELRGGW